VLPQVTAMGNICSQGTKKNLNDQYLQHRKEEELTTDKNKAVEIVQDYMFLQAKLRCMNSTIDTDRKIPNNKSKS
jgi:hypothetical protein